MNFPEMDNQYFIIWKVTLTGLARNVEKLRPIIGEMQKAYGKIYVDSMTGLLRILCFEAFQCIDNNDDALINCTGICRFITFLNFMGVVLLRTRSIQINDQA